MSGAGEISGGPHPGDKKDTDPVSGFGSDGQRNRADGQKASESCQRLDRLLAREGLGTRSEIKKTVRSGKVLVNGTAEKDPGRQVGPEDEIFFDGTRIGRDTFVYYMLNKPAGVITATQDSRQRTVLDLLRAPEEEGSGTEGGRSVKPVLRRGLFPVGRLDRDTEGLLLLTDDGPLAHRLLSPKRHVDKVYYAVVTGCVTQEDIRRFREGLRVDEELTAMPALLEVTEPREFPQAGGRVAADTWGAAQWTHTLVTIREGKFHQIKRMFEAVGRDVLYLKRLSMGPLQLDPALAPGQFRPLTPEEIRALQEI